MQLRFTTLYSLLLLLLLPLSGWARQDHIDTTQAVQILQQAEQRGEARYGVSVWRIDEDKPLLDYRGRERFTPASVTKIFSTATALIALGADYQFPTEIGYRGEITSDGILKGDLIIVGHGDPSLESKHYPRRKGIFYEQVYLALQQAGIQQIRGRIVVDASAYCDEGYLNAWPREDWGRRYAPAVYGVNLCDNIMQVGISAQEVARGAKAPTFLHPTTPGHAWQMDIQLVKRGNRLSISADRDSRTTRRLSGRLARRSSKRQIISCDLSNPAMALALQLAEHLQRRGIELADCQSVAYYDKSAPTLTTLLDIYLSPHLSELIRTCNYHSVNLYAEALLRSTGNRFGSVQQGVCISTSEALRQEMNYWRETCSLSADELALYDGSGLSRHSKLSPYALTATLRQVYRLPLPISDPFILSLPQVGREGTVRNLFPATQLTAYFKSGSIRGVQNYAGYVSYNGHTYCVSLLANDMRHRGTTRRTMTQVLKALFPDSSAPVASKA
ncbi:D-alanyl-D-alanine carboxypeptidase/D-alanyl-D-alanine-endopeptidase [uncultured Porphyromonas sp.]|uniref:D-alanyl-D-alanine carboxypeptidase/D-alanyl-D-alanine endopeptidase n=1 Tax=uncultured Porphyromonas sp. TaxID=159274 RepID=UPI00260BA17D|nr:D-alanyl-D-alanine carboxypeptidase/D-alanyl-D-alanine-endopeptidase [uncultured Porphyromonas sp.]